ncbi:cytosolic phospholipase A2, putative [Talaromyces stipitatus ATCC 10500]|uniref:Lysophospholipase n=1 Tax=Talaromyces stipitatus (strain ATCC 10500 / CBS 375.48 / QM 6759 / NRRL 1006) TaxID=441959 RepID=B8MJ53_TALSN|nr:cytosolic phospholipase A2, putative [Talaromyces stipitatus ATCC 10500]EED15715.1 cytosolic phospholipase A2, putative [Talaromyces stipitatus ATCC 10500]
MTGQETEEQRQYEEEILAHQHYVRQSDDSEAEDEKQSRKHGFSAKIRTFWDKKVKPAFPEAIADISLVKDVFTTESLIHKDIQDATRYPEINKVAHVRQGLELGLEEKAFLAKRKMHVRDHFAKYMGLDPEQVHPDDIPVIGFGGSGGGYRAMIGYIGYMTEMKMAGLWDLITYVAGVSGTCWSIAAYYTFSDATTEHIIDHFKSRLSPYHPLSDPAIRTTLTAINGPYNTLGPLILKQISGLHVVLMDLYSVFTTGYLFLHHSQESEGIRYKPNGDRGWWKWSDAHKWLNDGQEPLPIMTAIRHERPWKDWVDKEHPFKDDSPLSQEHAETVDAWYQWFEMTPYEIGCDELESWVPTWGFGRPFDEGKSTMQLPEQSLALLLGLCTSAPAGPLDAYLATIKRNLPSGSLGNAVHELALKITHMWGKQRTKVFQQHHPLHACNEHNFMFHMTPVPKGQARPPGIENSPRVHLLDSGLDNNCPTYVLLRPEREVDIIIHMDASSDVHKDVFQERVDQIGSRRGIRYTKRTSNVASETSSTPVHSREHKEKRSDDAYGQIYDGNLFSRPAHVIDSYGHTVTNPPAPICYKDNTIIYMPLLENEDAAPGFDPSTAKWSGSYNLVWTCEQVETLIKVSAANFVKAQANIRKVLLEVYEKKKSTREATHP